MTDELRGSRPFPLDRERKKRCLAVLEAVGMTAAELALHLEIDRGNISRLLNGREISASKEREIAEFLGVPQEYLFPRRTSQEIARMRQEEAEEKARKAAMKAERMELRARALGVA